MLRDVFLFRRHYGCVLQYDSAQELVGSHITSSVQNQIKTVWRGKHDVSPSLANEDQPGLPLQCSRSAEIEDFQEKIIGESFDRRHTWQDLVWNPELSDRYPELLVRRTLSSLRA
jgi:hypothetical protein